MCERGISQLLALLIVVGIIIGVAIVSSGILSSILIRQRPEGGDLISTGFSWWEESESGNGF